MDRFLKALFDPVDAASLAVFRVAFGLLLLWDVFVYLVSHRIHEGFLDPTFLFKYYGFSWVQPWPGDGLYYHFAALGVLALMITVGAFYRVACVLFTVGFTYVFLLDQAQYLNHFYMVILFCCLLCVIPAHRAYSVDAWRRPDLASATVPGWSLWMLRAQQSVVYFYAGVAKLNVDWLRGEPIANWISTKTDFPLVGSLFTHPFAGRFFAFSGLALDLFVAPFLLWKRTRMLAIAALGAFHVSNAQLFQIGIFPWMMLAGLTLYLDPDWPRRLEAFLRRRQALEVEAGATQPASRPLLVFLGLWFAVQLAVPLRHHLYPGDVAWTEEGHRFAWRMKLRSKTGKLLFRVTDPETGRSWDAHPGMHLSVRQLAKCEARPDMILQLAHHLGSLWKATGVERPEVRAISACSLNGRKAAPLIDWSVDLMTIERHLGHNDWIVPLAVPARNVGDVPAGQ